MGVGAEPHQIGDDLKVVDRDAVVVEFLQPGGHHGDAR
jgi:hypothetical protein